jgi:dihydrofolate reductase
MNSALQPTRNLKPATQNCGKPRLSLIAAMARNRVIGAGNKIPWHLPGELKMFKTITMGHPIIMGRKTWESIGRLLPGRTTIIVTRQRGYHVPDAIIAASLDAAIAACASTDEIFVIGGAQLYAAALPRADRIYLTTVDADVEGDTLMPQFDLAQWREHSSRAFAADSKNPYSYALKIFDRP